MAYIAFELDALNKVPTTAAACGVPPERITHGLVNLWAYCFREKVAAVSKTHILGFFGMDATAALEAFGFVEVIGDTLRVRGAGRYLRVADGRSRGGLNRAAKANRDTAGRLLKAGSKRGSKTQSKQEAGVQLDSDSSLRPAELQLEPSLSPNTDDRTPTTEERTAPAAPSPFAAAQRTLMAVYLVVRGSAYKWQGVQDTQAMKRILGTGASPDEMGRRFKRLLESRVWPSGSTVAQLDQRWNDLTGPSVVTTTPERKVQVL